MRAISYRSFQCVGDLKKFRPPSGSERSPVAHKHVPLVCPMPSEREWLQPSVPLQPSVLAERKRARTSALTGFRRLILIQSGRGNGTSVQCIVISSYRALNGICNFFR